MPIRTFKELRASPEESDEGSIDIIFVYALNMKKTKDLRRSLKDWLRRLKTSADIYVFSFNAVELLTGGKSLLNLLSEKLQKDVKQLDRSKGSQRRRIFLSHGMAGWIVQNALASYQPSPISETTMGVIFLGIPPINSVSEWNEYRTNFLRSLAKGMKTDQGLPYEILTTTEVNFQRMVGAKRGQIYVEWIRMGSDIRPLGVVQQNSEIRTLTRRLSTWRPPSRQGTFSSAGSNASNNSQIDWHQLSLPNVKQGDPADQKVISFIERMKVVDSQSVAVNEDAYQPSNAEPPKADMLPSESSSSGCIPSHKDYFAFDGRSKAPLSGIVPTLPGLDGDAGDRYEPRLSSAHPGTHNETELLDLNTNNSITPMAGTIKNEQRLEMLFALAAAYHQSSEFRQARYILENAMPREDDEKDAKSVMTLKTKIAILLLQEGEIKKAQAAFTQLEEEADAADVFDDRNLEIARWRGVSFDKLGEYPKALEKLQKTLRQINDLMTAAYQNSSAVNKASILTRSALALVQAHLWDFHNAVTLIKQVFQEAENAMQHQRENEEIRDLMNAIEANMAQIFTLSGDYDKAQEVNHMALKSMEQSLGSSHVATLECYILEARILALKSNIDQAERVCYKTLETMRHTLGKNHPTVLAGFETLVFIYRTQGRLTEARNNGKYLMETNKTILGLSHPQTLSSMSELARVYVARGELAEALTLQELVLKVASESPNTCRFAILNYEADLAAISCQVADWDRANEIARRVLSGQCKLTFGWDIDSESYPLEDATVHDSSHTRERGSENAVRMLLQHMDSSEAALLAAHPRIFSTMHWLGVSERERNLGDTELALHLHEKGETYRRQKLGPTHLDTLSSLLEVAITKRKSGRLESASKDASTAKQEIFLLLGDEHPDSLRARHEVSLIKAQFGDWREAAEEMSDVLKMRTLLLGSQHPDTLTSQIDLSIAFRELGKLGKAEVIQLQVLAAQLRLPQSKMADDPRILDVTARAELRAAIILKLKKITQRLELKRERREVETSPVKLQLLGDSLASIKRLVAIYFDQELFEVAIDLQWELISLEELHLGYDDPKTLESLSEVAAIYQAEGEQALSEIVLAGKDKTLSSRKSLYYYESRSNMAAVYINTDDLETACVVQAQTVDNLKKCEGLADPKIMARAVFDLAETKKKLGKTSEAIDN